MTNDNEFKVVVRSKGRRNRTKTPTLSNFTSLSLTEDKLCDSSYEINKITLVVSENIQTIKGSHFYQKLIENLTVKSDKTVKFICFGLGSLSSYISRYQLALGVQLQQEFTSESYYFDPCFTSKDIDVLKSFNCNVLVENLEGKYEVSGETDYVTVFYLPHCPKQLTNNLLWKNWSRKKLENIYLIANSFESILERSTKSVIQQNAALIEKILPFTTELILPEFEPAFEAFNDLALHKFDRLENVADVNFWHPPAEPVYQAEDIEFVRT